ncbi:MAG TPA: hypothetical protein VGG34_10430 [Opitutaceae bacterium]|jgi:hypothetical protein
MRAKDAILSPVTEPIKGISTCLQRVAGSKRAQLITVIRGAVAAAVIFSSLGCTAVEQDSEASPRDFHAKTVTLDPSLAGLSTTELIGRLQDESNQGVGTHATALVSGFIPLDVPARFGGGILGSRAPSVSPIMAALVSRGVEALPDLLEHLSDSRPTKLVVGQGFMGKWFGSEYDPRNRGQAPSGVDRPFGTSFSDDGFSTYTLKVGDLCYVAIGQIVGRNLLAVRYQPTLCLVVNSPVHRPSLAQAARADWSGLTKDEHRRQLAAEGAIEPLLFYYPVQGCATVGRLLDRDVYDDAGIYGFLVDDLFPAPTSDQARILSKFLAEHGPKYRAGLRLALQDLATRQNPYGNEQVQAKGILRSLFSDNAPSIKMGGAIVTYRDQQALVANLSAFEWQGLDTELWGVFQKAAADSPCGISGRLYRADLELECAKLLAHTERDAEITARFRKEITAFEGDDAEAQAVQGSLPRGNAGFHFAITQRLDQLRKWVAQRSSG